MNVGSQIWQKTKLEHYSALNEIKNIILSNKTHAADAGPLSTTIRALVPPRTAHSLGLRTVWRKRVPRLGGFRAVPTPAAESRVLSAASRDQTGQGLAGVAFRDGSE